MLIICDVYYFINSFFNFCLDVNFADDPLKVNGTVYATVGDKNVRLKCALCGNPPVNVSTIQWEWHGQSIPDGIQVSHDSLHIQKVEPHHFRQYTCSAVNPRLVGLPATNPRTMFNFHLDHIQPEGTICVQYSLTFSVPYGTLSTYMISIYSVVWCKGLPKPFIATHS